MISTDTLRRARIGVALRNASDDPDAAPLAPGEWYVDERGHLVAVYRDSTATQHVMDVDEVDFLDGLATRQIVFLSWG